MASISKKIISLQISAITVLFFLMSIPANATGIYVGGDLVQSYAVHQMQDLNSRPSSNNGKIQDADAVGYGVNAGFRLNLPLLVGFAEMFYDKIGTSSTAFESNSRDRIEINDRYGAKLNAGFSIFPRTSLFVGYGFANVSYNNLFYSTGQSLGKSEMAPIYSVGLLVDLLMGISLRASYDHQSLHLRYGDEVRNKTQLGTAKLGVMYSF